MKQAAAVFSLIAFVGCFSAAACQRDSPTEQVHGTTEEGADAIERAVNTPIEKAKGAEKMLQGAADRTAEQTQKGGD